MQTFRQKRPLLLISTDERPSPRPLRLPQLAQPPSSSVPTPQMIDRIWSLPFRPPPAEGSTASVPEPPLQACLTPSHRPPRQE